LTLDKAKTLENLIRNADIEGGESPRALLAFIDAEKVVDWQPALLDYKGLPAIGR
jgi:hypothetical protein